MIITVAQKMSEKGNLIVLPDKDAPPALRVIRGNGDCAHRERVIETRSRKVLCARCKVELDPIAVLAELAQDGSMLVILRRQRSSLKAEITRMTQTRDKLRTQVRRLKKRLDDE